METDLIWKLAGGYVTAVVLTYLILGPRATLLLIGTFLGGVVLIKFSSFPLTPLTLKELNLASSGAGAVIAIHLIFGERLALVAPVFFAAAFIGMRVLGA